MHYDDPYFWSAMVAALDSNPETLNQVMQDFETRAAELRRIRAGDRDADDGNGPVTDNRVGDDGAANIENNDNINLEAEMERDYGLTREADLRRQPVGAPPQDLATTLDSLELGDIWNKTNYRIPFGLLVTRVALLLNYEYASELENFAIFMLRVAIDEADLAESVGETEYTRQGRELHRAASFRYFIEIMNLADLLSRKHRDDMLLLYMLVTRRDVTLLRSGDASGVRRFIDPIEGREFFPVNALTRPFFIDIRLQNMYGNIDRSFKRLERSINLASTNYRRRAAVKTVDAEELVGREITLLLNDARALPDIPDVVPMEAANMVPYRIDRCAERQRIAEMLTHTMMVAMMAEEYRVYVSGDVFTTGNDSTSSTTNGSGARVSITGARRSRVAAGSDDIESARAIRDANMPIFYRFNMKRAVGTPATRPD